MAEATGSRSNSFLACQPGSWQTLFQYMIGDCHNCNGDVRIVPEQPTAPCPSGEHYMDSSVRCRQALILADSLKQPQDHDVGEVPDPDRRQAEHSRPAKGTAAQQIHGQGQSPGPEPDSNHGRYCMKHDFRPPPGFFAGTACAILFIMHARSCGQEGWTPDCGQEGWTPDCGAVIAGSRKFLSFRFPVISMTTPPAGLRGECCGNTK